MCLDYLLLYVFWKLQSGVQSINDVLHIVDVLVYTQPYWQYGNVVYAFHSGVDKHHFYKKGHESIFLTSSAPDSSQNFSLGVRKNLELIQT